MNRYSNQIIKDDTGNLCLVSDYNILLHKYNTAVNALNDIINRYEDTNNVHNDIFNVIIKDIATDALKYINN